jgi:predicted enzyme related to lactoylglutathione lyase
LEAGSGRDPHWRVDLSGFSRTGYFKDICIFCRGMNNGKPPREREMNMSTAKKKTKIQKSPPTPSSLVWFEIPADDLKRAQKFYSKLFGWKIEAFPGMPDYWHIDTGGDDASPDGGMTKRHYPDEPVTNYVLVASVEKSAAQVKKLGGKITKPKTEVPGMGFFVICEDTEGNAFALWEKIEAAD